MINDSLEDRNSQNFKNLNQTKNPQLPAYELLKQQSDWLAPARARLLRRVSIARCHRVLDLGAGYGVVTNELVRRCNGQVIAIDYNISALFKSSKSSAGAVHICADSKNLPFSNSIFDLVFSQFSLMWMEVEKVIAEVFRVLKTSGAFVAIEPDFGGMIEYPEAIASREIWISALSRSGADPLIGRKLPSLLKSVGFKIQTGLIPELLPPSPVRFQFLRGLHLTPEEYKSLETIEYIDKKLSREATQVVHLPFFLVTAIK